MRGYKTFLVTYHLKSNLYRYILDLNMSLPYKLIYPYLTKITPKYIQKKNLEEHSLSKSSFF